MNLKRLVFFIIWFLAAILSITSVDALGATIEVNGGTHLTNNNHRYNRNPSVVSYDGRFWLFYTKGDDGSTNGVRNVSYNPDQDNYVIWYKMSSTIAGLSTAPETKLLLSDTNRPVGFDQRDVSVAVMNDTLYVFASAGWGGSPQPIYYYTWNGSWSGPTSLGTTGGGHVNVAYDVNRVYLVMETGFDLTLQSIIYTWDGTTLDGPDTIASGYGVPKITLKDGNLYVVSIAPGATVIILHSSPASANPSSWTWISDPVTVPGAYIWDPCIFNDDTNLYVVAAPSTATPDHQWLVQTKSTDNGATWSTVKTISYGGYDTTFWWDFWPTGYFDGTDKYLFFTTEGNGSFYGEGDIAYIKMDWNLGNDHYFYIHNAVEQAVSSDTVKVLAGRYAENLVINKALTLLGAGQDSVTVYPAFSDIGQPNPQDPPSFRGSQMCVVQASNVTIDGLTFDGDSPTLTPPGTLDARNGIITNFTSGDWSNLKVQNCTVKNIYLRGLYAAAKTIDNLTGINFNHNNVSNVKGVSMQSAGMMLYGANGIAAQNKVLDASLGIFFHSSSDGTIIWNTVTASELCLGVNSNDGPMSISYNRVSNSDQGIQIISNLYPVEVKFNSISACSAGVVLYGGPDTVGIAQVNVWDDTIIGVNQYATYGIYASTDLSPWGLGNLWANLKRNIIKNNFYGIVLDEPSGNRSKTLSILIGGAASDMNFIYNNLSHELFLVYCNDNQTATYNYWGKSSYAQIEEEIYHKVDQSNLGLVTFDPGILHGDVNMDGQLSVADVVYLVNYLFKGGPAPELFIVADVNRDGKLTVSDVVYLINYLFKGGPAPKIIASESAEAGIGKIVIDKPKLSNPVNLHSVEK